MDKLKTFLTPGFTNVNSSSEFEHTDAAFKNLHFGHTLTHNVHTGLSLLNPCGSPLPTVKRGLVQNV